MPLNDCLKFAEGSRQRAVCDGSADLPLYKINAFRAMFDLAPIQETDRAVAKNGQWDTSQPSRGIGDVVAKGIHFVTLGLVKPCGSCTERQETLNQMVPFRK